MSAQQAARKRTGRPRAAKPTEFQQQIIRYALEFPEATLQDLSAELQSHPAQIRYHLKAWVRRHRACRPCRADQMPDPASFVRKKLARELN